MAAKFNRLASPPRGLEKGKTDGAKNIAALATSTRSFARTPKHTPTEHLAKSLKNIAEVIKLVLGTACQTGMTVSIVAGSQFIIGKHFKGPRGFFELFHGLFIPRIFIRVKSNCEFTIGIGNLRTRNLPIDAQHLVVVTALGHGLFL